MLQDCEYPDGCCNFKFRGPVETPALPVQSTTLCQGLASQFTRSYFITFKFALYFSTISLSAFLVAALKEGVCKHFIRLFYFPQQFPISERILVFCVSLDLSREIWETWEMGLALPLEMAQRQRFAAYVKKSCRTWTLICPADCTNSSKYRNKYTELLLNLHSTC